jgi:hypothetical protein
MIELFSSVPANQDSGSPAYVRALLNISQQDLQSSLIDVRTPDEQQVVLLLADGLLLGSYTLAGSTCSTITLGDLESLWSGNEARIRSLPLPRETVRSVQALFAWHPPKQTLMIQSSALSNNLASFAAQKASGMLHLKWSGGDGLVTLLDGMAINAEVFLGTSSGVLSGAAAMRQLKGQQEHAVGLAFYEAQTGSLPFQQLLLRQVLAELMRNILSRYSQMVGSGLLNALCNDISNAMRLNNLNIQALGEVIYNTHVFRSLDEAGRAYIVLIKASQVHMSRVLGAGLAQTIQNDALKVLAPTAQAVLREQSQLYSLAFR